MSAPHDQPQEKTASTDGHRVCVLRRFWRWSAFLRRGCALLGFVLVFVIDFFIVPYFAPIIAPLFEDANNNLSNLPGYLFNRTDPVGYTFVDIDNETFSDWRTPDGHTKRSNITELIRRIARKEEDDKPKAIVVDIDLSDTGADIDNENNKLKNDVTEYAKNETTPPLIFVHSLRARPHQPKEAPFGIADSILKGVESRGPIYFASSGFLRSADGKVRSWLLAELTCNDQKELKTIPSVELLLLAILAGKNHNQIDETVQQAQFPGTNCSPDPNVVRKIRPVDGKPKIQLSPRHLQDRIIYTMKMPSAEVEQQLTGDLRYSKARLLLVGEDGRQKAKEKDLFSDRIVVIGGSNEESRDIYNTPYGMMPGAMILINSISSLREHYQVRQFKYGVEKFIEIIIGIIVWILFEIFRLEMGLLVCVIGYGIAVIVSGVFLYWGISFGISGVVAGTLAHFTSKLLCNIGHDLNWRRAFLAKEFLRSRRGAGVG
jgi:hypothetical protein